MSPRLSGGRCPHSVESRWIRFATLAAASCREIGAIVVSADIRDLERIARVFASDYVAPY
jgi:hypothetical protein